MPAAGSWSSGDKRRGTRLHRLCTRSGPQCRSWSSRPGRAPPKPPGDLVGGLRAEAARWGARFRGLICALEIRVSFSDGDGVAAAPAAASPPLLPTPPPMMPSRTTPFKHKATPFERFMHETMGVPDGKAQQWLKTEGKLAKLEGDPCRWPVYLPTAWKKMGFDASRDEAVVRVATASTHGACGGSSPTRNARPTAPSAVRCGMIASSLARKNSCRSTNLFEQMLRFL